jgi:AcrR family transcriptional regulator
MGRRRAVSADEQRARRASLVEAAASLLESWSVEDLSMDRIAARAGVAKGTLYRYFTTREELLMSVWEVDHARWLEKAVAGLGSHSGPIDDRHLVDGIVGGAVARPRFCRLHGLVHPVLEGNLAPAAVRRFKVRYRTRMEGTARRVAPLANGISAARLLRWLLHLDAVMAGLLPLAAPPAAVELVLEDPELHGLVLDVEGELRMVAAATLAAVRRS